MGSPVSLYWARSWIWTPTRLDRRPRPGGSARRRRPTATCSPITCAGTVGRWPVRCRSWLGRCIPASSCGEYGRQCGNPSPTSLNRPVGSDRRLAVIRGDLAQAKLIGHMHGATVNDVLIAAIAGGLRELLSGRGEQVDELVLRAFIPVSLYHEQPGQPRANLDGAMFVPLPVGVPDPVRRLELISVDTAERKKKARPSGGALLPGRTVQRVALQLLALQRFMSVYAANVPGPPVPLYFAGARLLEVFPVVPIMANVTLGIGALTYAGQFNIAAVADRDTCPDIDVFVHGMQDTLQDLTASLLIGEPSQPTPRRSLTR